VDASMAVTTGILRIWNAGVPVFSA